ncbi:PAS domain-containing protein [Rhizobium sp. P32RR-XVIII]|uniref:PAS-domain containing protein n=1 Tax=Rhizobium sp. P32RR-XVIII TaxID=2726738 RepID=UPI001456D0CB|nr:PAS-domain containing protein [Rhizobium sp. P32RR-XVIII]NLS08198.1 PAS domain-containing protein [Rhizobium sp. P32RR-XVIII]
MLGADATMLLNDCPLITLVLDTAGSIVFANAQASDFFSQEGSIEGRAIVDILPDWPINPTGKFVLRSRSENTRQLKVTTSFSRVDNYPTRTVWIQPVDNELLFSTAAREAKIRLRHVIEMLPQAVCVFDSHDRYVLWNTAYEELYSDIAQYLKPGIPFEEILKNSLASGGIQEVVPDHEQWLTERMAKFRAPVSQEEHQLLDGRWLRYDDRRTPDGGAIGIRIDITELKQREEWLRQLFEANPMPMLLCDGNSLSILEANHAAADFYGYDREAFLSRKAYEGVVT